MFRGEMSLTDLDMNVDCCSFPRESAGVVAYRTAHCAGLEVQEVPLWGDGPVRHVSSCFLPRGSWHQAPRDAPRLSPNQRAELKLQRPLIRAKPAFSPPLHTYIFRKCWVPPIIRDAPTLDQMARYSTAALPCGIIAADTHFGSDGRHCAKVWGKSVRANRMAFSKRGNFTETTPLLPASLPTPSSPGHSRISSADTSPPRCMRRL